MENLHILGNLAPPTVLIAKHLVHYVASLHVPPAPQLCTPLSLLPGHPHHANRVTDAILAMELPPDDPLHIAPIYWQQFMLHRGVPPSIADLYTEACALF